VDRGRGYRNQHLPEPGYLSPISPQGPYHNNPFNNNSIGFTSAYLSRGDLNMMRTGYPMYLRPWFQYLAETQLTSPIFIGFGTLMPFIGNMGAGSNYYNIGHTFSYASTDQAALETIDLNLLKTRKIDGLIITNKNGAVLDSYTFGYNNASGTRLQLASVKSANEPNEYKFQYNPITTLPADYLTRKVDHWGFYNAATTDFNIYDQNNWSNYFTYRNPTSTLTTLTQGMLSQVQLPTGGVQRFIYELNSYKKVVKRDQTNGALSVATLSAKTNGGGVRIKEIHHYESTTINSTNLKKSEYYEYGDGLLNGEPQYHWSNFKGKLIDGTQVSINKFSTYNLNPASINGEGAPVAYKEVTVKETGNGKTKYVFSNFETNPDIPGVDFSFDKILAFPASSKDFERGKLLTKEIYTEDLATSPIVVENYVYQANPGTATRFIPAVLAQAYRIYPDDQSSNQNPNYVEGTAYKQLIYPYQLKTKKVKTLDRLTMKWSEVEENYTYSNGAKWLSEVGLIGVKGTAAISVNDNQLKSESVIRSDKSIYTTYYTHPLDYRQGLFSTGQTITNSESKGLETLIDNLNIATVISEQVSRKNDGSSIETYKTGKLSTFKRGTDGRVNDGQSYYSANAASTYTNSTGATTAYVHNFSPTQFTPAVGFRIVNQNLSHDKYSNVTEQKALGQDAVTVVVWGYKGQYPIIQITGVPLSTVTSILNSTTLSNLDSETVTDATISNAATLLRNHTNLKYAQVESYTYKSGVGLTSKTDSRGQTEYYEYDTANRLWVVKDFDGNVLRSYDYNFRTP